MRRRSYARVFTLALIGWVNCAAGIAAAAEGRRITYQGRVTGVLPGNVKAVNARIFPSAVAANTDAILWGEERHEVTPDANGNFVIVLGASGLDQRRPDGNGGLVNGADGTPDLDQIDPTANSLFLELELELGGGELALLRPRQQLFPAFHAQTANEAQTARTAERLSSLISQSMIEQNAVGSDQVDDLSITTIDIGDRQVTSDKIEDGAITNAKIAPNQITNDLIADAVIRGSKLASDGGLTCSAITADQLCRDSVGSSEIADGAIKKADVGFFPGLSCYRAFDTEKCSRLGACAHNSPPCLSGFQLVGGGCLSSRFPRCLVRGADSPTQVVAVPALALLDSRPLDDQWRCFYNKTCISDVTPGNNICVPGGPVTGNDDCYDVTAYGICCTPFFDE